jgi:hypothetical protein
MYSTDRYRVAAVFEMQIVSICHSDNSFSPEFTESRNRVSLAVFHAHTRPREHARKPRHGDLGVAAAAQRVGA